MSTWYFENDEINSLPIDDRGAQYGDGLFETIAIRNGSPRFLSLHLERLQTGCERIGISPPPAESIRLQLESALASCGLDCSHAIAKIIVSSGSGPRGYRRPAGGATAIRIGIMTSQPLPTNYYRDGITTRICRTRLAQNPQVAGIKSLGRLEQVLASAEWDEGSIFEGLMLDTDERLICGTMSNVFIVRANRISTPGITRCGVSGTMRRHVISLLEEATIPCDVRDIPAAELEEVDEAFLTNSQFGVLPIRRCGRHDWPVGETTRQVMGLAAAHGVTECSP